MDNPDPFYLLQDGTFYLYPKGMLYLGVIGMLLGFALLFFHKNREMKNTTSGGVVRHRNAFTGFLWHIFKILSFVVVMASLLATILGVLGGGHDKTVHKDPIKIWSLGN